MNINVAMASGEAVVLLEAVMIVLIAATTTTGDTATSTAASASSHALKPVAVPSLTTTRATTRRLFEAIQVAG
jgi:hypothetical protein